MQDLDLYDMKYFDVQLGTTLQEMQALAAQRQYIESMSAYKSKEILSLHYRGEKIEDLCIDFTLPGFPHYLLKMFDIASFNSIAFKTKPIWICYQYFQKKMGEFKSHFRSLR